MPIIWRSRGCTVSSFSIRDRTVKKLSSYWIRPPVHDWLTEGFDTLDLREAKALLDEMGL
jgi:hypothetical protein